MSLSHKQQIFTLNIAKLILRAQEMGVLLTFGEAWRTEDQQELYFYGKTIRKEDHQLELISGARRTRTMKSNHLRRLAVDFNFFINGKLDYKHPKVAALGLYWESLHPMNRWGGHFQGFFDAPHFEMNAP